MPSQYVTALVPQIRGILKGSDLSTISAKGVRKQLVDSGHEEAVIKENRKDIDQKIAEIYEELTANVNFVAPPTPVASSSAAPEPSSSLPEPLRRPTIKKEIKQEVKPEPRHPPPTVNGSLRGPEETDEQMALRLQREFDSEQSRGRASRSGGSAKKKVKKTKKRKATGNGDADSDEGKPKKKRAGGGGGAFNKELILSDALADLVGEARLSRPQCVKRIWEYVKERDLQDASDKRYILCDDRLRQVFHTDRLHMFTMNKILVDHLRDPDEIAFKAEPGSAPSARPIRPPIPTPTATPPRVKRNDNMLSSPVIVDSDEDEEGTNGPGGVEEEDDESESEEEDEEWKFDRSLLQRQVF